MVKSLAGPSRGVALRRRNIRRIFHHNRQLHSAGSIAEIAAITSTAHFVHERVWHKDHCRFPMELPWRFTLGFLRRVFVEKFSADRYRRCSRAEV